MAVVIAGNDLSDLSRNSLLQQELADRVAQQQAEVALRRQLGLGDLDVRRQGLGVQRELGLGDIGVRREGLGVQRQLGLGDLDVRRLGLGVQERLGLGDIGVRNRAVDVQRELGLGDIGVRKGALGVQERLGQRGLDVQEGLGYGNIGLQYDLGMGSLGNQRIGMANQFALGQGSLANQLTGLENQLVLGNRGFDVQEKLGLGQIGANLLALDVQRELGQGQLGNQALAIENQRDIAIRQIALNRVLGVGDLNIRQFGIETQKDIAAMEAALRNVISARQHEAVLSGQASAETIAQMQADAQNQATQASKEVNMEQFNRAPKAVELQLEAAKEMFKQQTGLTLGQGIITALQYPNTPEGIEARNKLNEEFTKRADLATKEFKGGGFWSLDAGRRGGWGNLLPNEKEAAIANQVIKDMGGENYMYFDIGSHSIKARLLPVGNIDTTKSTDVYNQMLERFGLKPFVIPQTTNPINTVRPPLIYDSSGRLTNPGGTNAPVAPARTNAAPAVVPSLPPPPAATPAPGPTTPTGYQPNNNQLLLDAMRNLQVDANAVSPYLANINQFLQPNYGGGVPALMQPNPVYGYGGSAYVPELLFR